MYTPHFERAVAAVGLRHAMWISAAVLALASVGCVSPPPAHLHTLMPVDRPVARAGTGVQATPTAVIVLEAIEVPMRVESPRWLIRLPDGSLVPLEQERWASPLADELRDALLDILTLRFGAVEGRFAGRELRVWRIHVHVERFESLVDEARLESTWTVTARGLDAPALRCTTAFRTPSNGAMSALAEAHRRNVAQLSEVIGEQLLALQRGEPARCPS